MSSVLNNFLNVGDIFTINFLPNSYRDKVYFQTMKVSHDVSADDWKTTLDTQLNYAIKGQNTTTLPKPKRIYPKVGKVAMEKLAVLPDSVPPDFGGLPGAVKSV